MNRRGYCAALLAAILCLCAGPSRAAQDTVKIGYIDAFSGTFATAGDIGLKALQYIVGFVNAHDPPLGEKFELVTFDDKFQPSEALIALGRAGDQGIRFVINPGPSNIAAALIGAVAKNNERNPDQRVLFLNLAREPRS